MEPVLRAFREDDCPRLARMWNESREAWPGGFIGELTEEYVRDWETQDSSLFLKVVELGDRIVGYCKVVARAGAPEYAYLALLNVSPDCHGRGIGRLMVHDAVQEAIDRNLRMFDINTWPSNMKAVPLYKKCGFCWVPETMVYMENYVPQVVNTPMARPFFEKHDWYANQVRTLDQEVDEVKWHGKNCFPYRWEGDGDVLKVVVDREARWLTAFENNTFRAAAWGPPEKVVAGIPHEMTWEIENKTDAPLSVTLLAEGEDRDVALRKAEYLEVHDSARLTADFTVAPLFTRKDGDITSHIIKTDLVVNGAPLTLRTGFRVIRPVSLGLVGWRRAAAPGTGGDAIVNVVNESETPFRGAVCITCPEGLSVTPKRFEFEVGAKGRAGWPVQVRCGAPGSHEVLLTAELDTAAGTVKAKPERVPHLAPGPGDVVGFVGEDSAILAGEGREVHLHLRTAFSQVLDRGTGRQLAVFSRGFLGPPFTAPWNDRTPAEVRIETGNGAATCVLSWIDPRFPNVRMEQRVTLSADGGVRIEDRCLNEGPAPQAMRHRRWVSPADGGYDHIVLPLRTGLVREPRNTPDGFPGVSDVPEAPEGFAEPWMACDWDGGAAGVIWPDTAEVCVEHDNIVEMTRPVSPLEPGEWVRLAPVRIATAADWQGLRREWLRTVGGVPVDDEEPVPVRRVEVRTDPAPVVIVADKADLALAVVNHGGRELKGRLDLAPPEGWTAEPRAWSETPSRKGEPFSAKVELSAPAGLPPGIHLSRATRYFDGGACEHDLPIVVAGHGGRVRVEESSDTVMLDNGAYILQVAPGFNGSLFDIEHEGRHLLSSSWPEPGNFAYIRPWHGGVHPALAQHPGPLFKTGAEHEIVERAGRQGVPWTGVKVAVEPEHRNVRGLRVEVEYLTTGESNLVAVLLRYVNLTSAAWWLTGDVQAFPQPGGSRDNLEGAVEDADGVFRRKPGVSGHHMAARKWAGVTDPATGAAAALVTTHPSGSHQVIAAGLDGPWLTAPHPVMLKANETREVLSWLVFARSMDEARRYAALRALSALP